MSNPQGAATAKVARNKQPKGVRYGGRARKARQTVRRKSFGRPYGCCWMTTEKMLPCGLAKSQEKIRQRLWI